MSTRRAFVLTAGGLMGSLLPLRASASGREIEAVESSIDILDDLTEVADGGIPRGLLRSAFGVAVIPDMIKAGFIIGGRHGRGILVVKEKAGWSNPIFISMTGGSVGWQIGAQSTDLVLVLRTRRSVERIMRGRGKFTLGADASVAAGPIGRDASAGTDIQLKAEIYTYSRSRGLFAGVSLEGAGIRIDWNSIDRFYNSNQISIEDVFAGRGVQTPEVATRFRALMNQLTEEPKQPRSG